MKVAKTATDALKILWEEGFFEENRNIGTIKEKLTVEKHNFSDAELGMALKRAQYLTRIGKRGNYNYRQKHPFVKDPISQDTGEDDE